MTIEVSPMHLVRSLRAHLSRCSGSGYKQIGLRRLQEASRVASKDHEFAMDLIREAGLMLRYARSEDARSNAQ